MNKNKKTTSGLILAGTSLASIAGQAATNVSAEGSIFGSIKNFSSVKNEKTKKSLNQRKSEALELRYLVNKAGNLDKKGCYANICADLKGEIREDMLNKQYTLKEFEDIVKNEQRCSEFIKQLLVLDRASENEGFNEVSDKLPGNGELEEAKETLKKLFLEIDSVDKINDLKKLTQKDKEKLLKVFEPLYYWVGGNMSALFGEEDYFVSQRDDSFLAKVVLLLNVLNDAHCGIMKNLDEKQFLFFLFNNPSEECQQNIYVKALLKSDICFKIDNDLSNFNLNTEINKDLLFDSVKTLFGNLRGENEEKKLDEEKNENSKKSLLDSVAKEYYSKFKDYENPKAMSMAVLDAIRAWVKEKVDNCYEENLYNKKGKKESLISRIHSVWARLEFIGQKN